MLHDIVKKGSVDRSVTVKIIDSTDGTPETGVVFNTSGIDLWYRREGAAKTSITEATLAALTTAHSDGGFLHVSDGVYRLDLPDAAFATGANYVDFGGVVTGMIVIGGRVRLIDADFEAAILTDAEIALAVWANATRQLTDATNITSTGGTTVPQTGDAYARLGAPAGASTAADVAAVKSDTAAILADTGTDGVVVASASKTGYTLSSAGIQAIWDALTSALTTVGSIGKLLVDNINATISSRLASASYTTPPTVGAIADQVWEETLTDHSGTSGSTAAALNAAGSAGDPWGTALPGAYGAGTAGKIIGDNLNATVGSRATQTSVDDLPTNAELATALGTADDAVLAAIAALNNLSQANIRTAIGLASANLDTQLDALPTNAELATALGTADDAVLSAIAALNNLSAAQVATELGTYDAPTKAELDAAIASLNDLSAAAVNAELLDVLTTDTFAEPAAVPAATASLKDKIGFLAVLARNKVTQTSTTQTLRDDADTVDVATATVSDDGTTFERSQWT